MTTKLPSYSSSGLNGWELGVFGAAASEKDSLEDYHPICFLVLTEEDIAYFALFDWNVIVGAYLHTW
jgi:hypothetical protein